jgi:hypothetical protein
LTVLPSVPLGRDLFEPLKIFEPSAETVRIAIFSSWQFGRRRRTPLAQV